jgi:drug/metabolite transporter (DMT)-like permease
MGTVVFAAIGQLIIKSRVDIHGQVPDGWRDKFFYFAHLVFDPYVMFAFFLAFLSALSWMAAVSKFELNFVYPLLIVSLLLVTVISSTLLLHESFTVQKLVGVMLISAGAIVMIKAG